MESSGLRRILDKHSVLDHAVLRRLVSDHYEDAQNDELELMDNMKEEVRMNFSDPRGCFDAILENTEGRALDFFASTLKHLLLIPTELDLRMRHFQLIERLVSAVVTDRKGLDGDFSSLLGSSVASIVASFGDQDRLEIVLEEVEDAKATIHRLKTERETLLEQIDEGAAGNVRNLKEKVEKLDRALILSRAATDTTKTELSTTHRDYQAHIAALRADNRELYERLKKAGMLDGIEDALQERMEKQIQRMKTVQILEGQKTGTPRPPSKPGQQLLGSSSARRKLESITADGLDVDPGPSTPTTPHHPQLVSNRASAILSSRTS